MASRFSTRTPTWCTRRTSGSRFLDKRFVDRIGRRAARRVRHVQPGDGRRPLHPAHDDPLRAVPEGHQLDQRGHDRHSTARRSSPKGFTGDRVARRPRARGRRRHGHLRARVRHVDRGHRPGAAGGDGPRLQPVGRGDARDLGQPGPHLGAGAAQRRLPGRRGDPVRPRRARHPLLLGAAQPRQPSQPRRPLLRPDLGAARRTSDCAFATHEFMGAERRSSAGVRALRHLHRVAHRRAPVRGHERRACR